MLKCSMANYRHRNHRYSHHPHHHRHLHLKERISGKWSTVRRRNKLNDAWSRKNPSERTRFPQGIHIECSWHKRLHLHRWNRGTPKQKKKNNNTGKREKNDSWSIFNIVGRKSEHADACKTFSHPSAVYYCTKAYFESIIRSNAFFRTDVFFLALALALALALSLLPPSCTLSTRWSLDSISKVIELLEYERKSR